MNYPTATYGVSDAFRHAGLEKPAPYLIRGHPVFLFLDSGQRTTLVRVRRNDNTAGARGMDPQKNSNAPRKHGKMNPRTHCIRCGECCIQSSPTLQVQDLCLLDEGAIARQNLYTIRKGEMVWDNVIEALIITREEMIKIREREDGGCIYFNDADKACKIYEKRPAQCSAMACWDPARFMKVYKEPKLTRMDAIKNPVIAGLVRAHESKCSYEAAEGHVKRVEMEGDKAVEAIIQILRFDDRLRPYLSQKLDLDLKEMDFILGRPMTDTIVMFGLKVEKRPDGSFYLTTLPQKTGGKT